MKAIIGLGNPESHYAGNRHNVGFLIVDRIAAIAGVRIRIAAHYARYCRVSLWGEDTLLVKPQTFMNRSGLAAREIIERWQVAFPDLLIVHDDFALPLGRIRLRPSGSAAGHNGMASVIAELGAQEIPRLRFGIGSPQAENRANFVLSDFAPREIPVVQETIDRSIEAIRCLWEQGMLKAMSLFNRDPEPSCEK